MMTSPETQQLTTLLRAWGSGDEAALNELAVRVGDELRKLARHYLKREQSNPLLESGVLVNEAWLRLIDWQNTSWENRSHFFGVAAQMMRHILTDEARRRTYQKRGGEAFCVSLSEVHLPAICNAEELLGLSTALDQLFAFDERKAKIVELRFFGGLEQAEIAQLFGLSTRTVQRELRLAQAWLYRELKGVPQQESANESSISRSNHQ
jgi:RNA polymerase sigma-70 factor, ECF subfamily